jgi:nucleotide-binding universal stress UspA family protein
MAIEARSTSKADVTAQQLFKRVLVGVDPSPAGAEATRQAALLTDAEGTLTLLAAWTVPPPTIGAELSRELDAEIYRGSAENAIARAKTALPPQASSMTKVVRGLPWDELTKEATAAEATLIVVGSHGQGRMRGILMGSTATEIIHKAPCSVLVARPAKEPFPLRIVVGVDGSPESAAAYAAARQLVDRFGSQLWPVVAHGGKDVCKDAVTTIVDDHYEDLPDEPVHALVAASADADLLIVGSRGLHGYKALGSVSERVAHQARCSTLIVREGASSGEAQ